MDAAIDYEFPMENCPSITVLNFVPHLCENLQHFHPRVIQQYGDRVIIVAEHPPTVICFRLPYANSPLHRIKREFSFTFSPSEMNLDPSLSLFHQLTNHLPLIRHECSEAAYRLEGFLKNVAA